MIRAVLFDLDRTLADRDTSLADFAAGQYRRFRAALGSLDERTYVDRLIAHDARGAVWKDVAYQRLAAELAPDAPAWQDLFADFDRHIAAHYVTFPGVRETLAALAPHHRLGLITNGLGEFQQRTIDALDLGPFFDAVLISEVEGVRKPDAAIFHRALERLGSTPAEAVFVGDHPESDIAGARRAGLRAIWKRNADFPAPPCDGVIDDLPELPALLRSLAPVPG